MTYKHSTVSYNHWPKLKQVPSVLWHCWLGIRKSIWPVNIEWWGVGVVICLERGADCLHMVQSMPPHPKTPSSLAWFKSRLVLPFWYQLTQVVLEKRPLNGCSSEQSSNNIQKFVPESKNYTLPGNTAKSRFVLQTAWRHITAWKCNSNMALLTQSIAVYWHFCKSAPDLWRWLQNV